MDNIIQLSRHHPGKKWNPAEILAIKEEPDTRSQKTRDLNRIATTKAIAAAGGKRKRKKEKRKKAIADILGTGQQWTITVLMRLVSDRTGEHVSRATVTEILKELEAEGRAENINQFWKSANDLHRNAEY
jgi:hypothetical protein